MSKYNRFVKLWGAPIAIGILSLVGLIAALVGDGFMDGLSWGLLTLPLLLVVFFTGRAFIGRKEG